MFHPRLFEGKNIVVTGAGRGIGLEVARQFLDCGGHAVVHVGRRITDDLPDFLLEAQAERRAFLVAADFLEAQGVSDFVSAVQDRFDVVHVLINNAGTMVGRFPSDELTDAQYETVVRLNQTSVMEVTRALIPMMKTVSDGAIVNTVSISALTGGSPGSGIYSGAKAFVAAYSKSLSKELAPFGIRVNCVSPGTIATDFHERYSSREKLEATRKAIPLQRLGTPEDCAPAYLFLAAESLSGYITGQVIEVNGGQLIC